MANKTKKINILTFSRGDNYGAVLQSYALAEALRRLGLEVEFFKLTRWYSWKYRIISHISPLKYRFNNFRRNYLRNFSKECSTSAELTEVASKADYCIVGSDQVWNPKITKERTGLYFLDFVPDDIPRISYAASFGTSEWEHPNLTPIIKENLKKFSSISVREDRAVEICKKVFGVNATLALDPTLLLGDFKNLLKRSNYRDYVVSFMFNPSKELYQTAKKLSRKLETKYMVMDLPNLHFHQRIVSDAVSPFCSPEMWVTNIANAKAIVTDSFHCLCFSIIFKKDFYFVATKKKLISRVTSLLNALEIEGRIFDSVQALKDYINSPEFNIRQTLNYATIDRRLESLRDYSYHFLRKALNLEK